MSAATLSLLHILVLLRGSDVHGLQILPPVLNVTEEVILTKTDQLTDELIITCMGQQPLKWHTPHCHPPCCHEMEDNDVDIIKSASGNETYPFASTLKVHNHKANHTGLYSCMYKDATVNNYEMKATTYVYFYRPDKGVELANDITDIDTVIGSKLVLNCRPTHPNVTVSLQFYYENVDLSSDKRITFDPQKGFIIKDVTKNDDGEYLCSLSPNKIIVNIKDAIPLLPKAEVEIPGNPYFVVGEDITLICKSSTWDFPYPLHAQWTTPQRSTHYSTNPKKKSRSVLIINKATLEDSGNYSCSISGPCNIYDQSETTTIPIQVQEEKAVEFVNGNIGWEQIVDANGNVGWKQTVEVKWEGNFWINCSVNGYPKPNIYWYKDDVLINATDLEKIGRPNAENPYQLELVNIQNIEGTYRCVANNTMNGIHRSVILNIYENRFTLTKVLVSVLVLVIVIPTVCYFIQKRGRGNKKDIEGNLEEDKNPLLPPIKDSPQAPGLIHLVPLYKLLRSICTETIFNIVVTEFQNCRFFSEDEDAQTYIDKHLYDFLIAINTKGKNKQEELKSNAFSLSVQEFQELMPQVRNQLQNLKINNLQDNEEILENIFVDNMLKADVEHCKSLKKLNINFILNIVTNDILRYRLSESVNKSISQVKDICNELDHAKYNFSREDFNRIFKKLQEIYKDFRIPNLDMQIEECESETPVNTMKYLEEIIKNLQIEIHAKYKSPQNFVCPMIREDCDNEERYFKSLEIYLQDHQSKPILLCGKRGSGKISILQNQAYQLVKKINDDQDHVETSQFSLVILFEDNHHEPMNKENFWYTVTYSMKYLAPNTAASYGIETLMVAIKMHIKETIFFVNWTLQDIPAQFEEMSNGTWVFTHHDYPEKTANWNILIIEQSELNGDPVSKTEFELMIKDVKRIMDEGNLSKKIIRDVGNLAFHGIKKNKQRFFIDEVKVIDKPGRVAFFNKNRNYFEFINNKLMYFLASVYVIEELNEACKVWLSDTPIFKRVFKFACSFWFSDVDHDWKGTVQRNGTKKDYLEKMEDFLCKFLSVKKYRTEREKNHKSCSPEIKEREMLMSGNPIKNPFSKWVFLVHIYEACNEVPEVLEILAGILSYIECWVFKCKYLKYLKMRSVQMILEKVELNKSFPVLIKIESGSSCGMLLNIWKMLKETKSLHNAVKVTINIMHVKREGKEQILKCRQSLEKLHHAIVNNRDPLYITELRMPLISPKIPDFKFSMCECIQKLEYLDAKVYDVNSLREVMVCGGNPYMKSVKIYVDFSEHRINNPPQLKIPNPKNTTVKMTIVYFKEIQELFNSFTCRHHLLSLSICDIVVDENFNLDFSAFKNMESLYLHCDMNDNVPNKTNCVRLLSENLILPKELERLLLSKVQFYDTNIDLFRKFVAKYKIQKLMILDSNLSLYGARRALQMFQEKETDLDFKMEVKQPRLSILDRKAKQENKPKGKEIIITSNTELNSICSSEPCQCKIQCTTNTSKYLSDLINDAYHYNIVRFAFQNKNVIVCKDVCNDLRVHCPLFKTMDNEMYQIPSPSPILQLFQSLKLTQSLYIEKTTLSYHGIKMLVTNLKNYKSKQNSGLCEVEPFSLTVTSDYYPCKDVNWIDCDRNNSQIINFLKKESCLTMFNFWCTCDSRCHKLKKTHDGDIYVNDKKY